MTPLLRLSGTKLLFAFALIGLTAFGAIVTSGEENAEDYYKNELDETNKLVSAPSPIAWCASGGGWRALSVAMGFARLFQRAGLLAATDLASVACNSGGCWFLSLFAYSEKFYEETIGSESIEAVTERVLTRVLQPMGNEKSAAGCRTPCSATFQAAQGDWACNPCLAASHHQWNWKNFVKYMLAEGAEVEATELKSIMADKQSRVGLKGPTLLFQTANLTSTYVHKRANAYVANRLNFLNYDKDNISARRCAYYTTGTFTGEDVLDYVPLQFVIPGESVTDKDEVPQWVAPPKAPKATAIVLSRKAEACTRPTKAQDANYKYHNQSIPLPFGGSPTVVEVAAASSAAAGFLGSPGVVEGAQYTVKGAAVSTNQQEGMSVCADSTTINKTCQYPSARLVDGAFVDNIATAMTVANLQRRYKNQPLRLVLTDAAELPSPVNYANVTDIRELFRSTTRPDKEPGDLVANYAGLPGKRPLPIVFDDTYEEIEWGELSVGTTGSLGFAQLQTKTVENGAFDVAKGTVVELLIFSSRSKLHAMERKPKDYAELANAIASSPAKFIVAGWMSLTGGSNTLQA